MIYKIYTYQVIWNKNSRNLKSVPRLKSTLPAVIFHITILLCLCKWTINYIHSRFYSKRVYNILLIHREEFLQVCTMNLESPCIFLQSGINFIWIYNCKWNNSLNNSRIYLLCIDIRRNIKEGKTTLIHYNMSLSSYNQNNRHLFVSRQSTIHNENNNIENKIKHRLFDAIIDDLIDSAQQLNSIINKVYNSYSSVQVQY